MCCSLVLAFEAKRDPLYIFRQAKVHFSDPHQHLTDIALGLMQTGLMQMHLNAFF